MTNDHITGVEVRITPVTPNLLCKVAFWVAMRSGFTIETDVQPTFKPDKTQRRRVEWN